MQWWRRRSAHCAQNWPCSPSPVWSKHATQPANELRADIQNMPRHVEDPENQPRPQMDTGFHRWTRNFTDYICAGLCGSVVPGSIRQSCSRQLTDLKAFLWDADER